MLTRVVFLLNILLLSLHTHATFFPDGSHNRPIFPATGGIITLDEKTPTRLIRRQASPSTTANPIVQISNTTDWSDQTNQLCMASFNVSAITNPAGVIPCYNVLWFDPNTGMFLAEVRLFQVVNMMQTSVLSKATGSGVLFEFPHASITSSPGSDDLSTVLNEMNAMLVRRQTQEIGQVNIVDAFLMNGTADITQKYHLSRNDVNGSIAAKQLLTPTTATLTLNMSSSPTPYSMTDSMILFVNGLFSPSFVASQAAAYILSRILLTYRASSTPTAVATGFVLPGISFGIVPIGFYMFSAYWGVFTVILLWGAWNKRKVCRAFPPC